jgi:hypothetical protein
LRLNGGFIGGAAVVTPYISVSAVPKWESGRMWAAEIANRNIKVYYNYHIAIIATGKLSLTLAYIEAVGLTTSKNRGEAAEAAFLAKATSLGFGVCKPWGDSERYDFVIDSGYRFWRVQVKSSQLHYNRCYHIKTSGFNNKAYSRREIDFLIAYIVPENLWYIVPVGCVPLGTQLRFYPAGSGRESRVEKYREAWCQLACPRDEDGPSRILVHRPCQRPDPANCPLCEKGSRRYESPRR